MGKNFHKSLERNQNDILSSNICSGFHMFDVLGNKLSRRAVNDNCQTMLTPMYEYNAFKMLFRDFVTRLRKVPRR